MKMAGWSKLLSMCGDPEDHDHLMFSCPVSKVNWGCDCGVFSSENETNVL
jgi:hypothetical protein